MILFPAIDIKDGTCVRLYKGDFSTAAKVAEDPLTTAAAFRAAGAVWLHTVDLNGALEGKRVNADIFTRLAAESGLQVEVGGGIRSMEDIDFYLSRGIARVILGSVAIQNPALVREATARYGDRIAVGIDAKNGYAAAGGWLDVSELYYTDLAKRMEASGVATIIFTDISRDGTLSGPNLEMLAELQTAVDCNVVASGGIHNIEDIRALRDLGLYGAICGKSLYSGTLDLGEAVRLCEE